jgi:hypothetical protein
MGISEYFLERAIALIDNQMQRGRLTLARGVIWLCNLQFSKNLAFLDGKRHWYITLNLPSAGRRDFLQVVRTKDATDMDRRLRQLVAAAHYFIDLKDWDALTETAQAAIAVKPDSVDGHYWRALACARSGQMKKAWRLVIAYKKEQPGAAARKKDFRALANELRTWHTETAASANSPTTDAGKPSGTALPESIFDKIEATGALAQATGVGAAYDALPAEAREAAFLFKAANGALDRNALEAIYGPAPSPTEAPVRHRGSLSEAGQRERGLVGLGHSAGEAVLREIVARSLASSPAILFEQHGPLTATADPASRRVLSAACGRLMHEAVESGDLNLLSHAMLALVTHADGDPVFMLPAFPHLAASQDKTAIAYFKSFLLPAFERFRAIGGGGVLRQSRAELEVEIWSELLLLSGVEPVAELLTYLDDLADSVYAAWSATGIPLKAIAGLSESGGLVPTGRFTDLLSRDAIATGKAAEPAYGVALAYLISRGDPVSCRTGLEKIISATKAGIVKPSRLTPIFEALKQAPSAWSALDDLAVLLADTIAAKPDIFRAIHALLCETGSFDLLRELLRLLRNRGVAAVGTSESLDKMIDAITPKTVTGGLVNLAETKNAGTVLIATDLDLDFASIKRLGFGDRIFVFKRKGELGSNTHAPEKMSTIDPYLFNDRQSFIRDLANRAELFANEFSRYFQDAITDPKLRAVCEDLADAIFISLRNRILGVFRMTESRRSWMQEYSSQVDEIIIVASRWAFVEEIAEAAPNPEAIAKIRFFCLSPSMKRMVQFSESAADSKLDGVIARSEAAETPNSPQAMPHRPLPVLSSVVQTGMLSFYENHQPKFAANRQGGDGTLFVCRTSFKTVPGTIAPLIRRFLQKGDVQLLDIVSPKDEQYGIPIEQTQVGGRLESVLTKVLRAEAAEARSTGEDPLAAWFRDVFSRVYAGTYVVAGLNYFDRIHDLGGGFLTSDFYYMLSLQKTTTALVDQFETFRVIACPGRSIEAYCAQQIATRRNMLSMDVMNAWMSSAYTYAVPRGDIVTAIDQWSVDILRENFGVEPRSIMKVGTPRYDEIPRQARAVSIPEIRSRLALDPGIPTLCFATQPVGMEINLKILAAIIGAYSEDCPFQIIVKLHPREMQQRVDAYMNAIERSSDAIVIRVVREMNIIETICASDLIVAMFSNVCVEASLCDRDVLVADFGDMRSPIPIVEMGLGLAAKTPEGLQVMIRNVLSHGDLLDRIRQNRKRYLGENEHLLRGDAADRIYQFAHRSDLAGISASRSLCRDGSVVGLDQSA